MMDIARSEVAEQEQELLGREGEKSEDWTPKKKIVEGGSEKLVGLLGLQNG